jgi:hypothetical protein
VRGTRGRLAITHYQNEWAVEVSTQTAAPHSPKNHKIASQKRTSSRFITYNLKMGDFFAAAGDGAADSAIRMHSS